MKKYQSQRPKLKEIRKPTVGPCGGNIAELGKGTFELQLGSLVIEKEILVANILDDVLLGADILVIDKQGPANFYLDKSMIVLKGIQIPVILKGLPEQIRKVQTVDQSMIPDHKNVDADTGKSQSDHELEMQDMETVTGKMENGNKTFKKGSKSHGSKEQTKLMTEEVHNELNPDENLGKLKSKLWQIIWLLLSVFCHSSPWKRRKSALQFTSGCKDDEQQMAGASSENQAFQSQVLLTEQDEDGRTRPKKKIQQVPQGHLTKSPDLVQGDLSREGKYGKLKDQDEDGRTRPKLGKLQGDGKPIMQIRKEGNGITKGQLSNPCVVHAN